MWNNNIFSPVAVQKNLDGSMTAIEFIEILVPSFFIQWVIIIFGY